MRNLNKFFLFIFLLTYIIGLQPAWACMPCEEVAGTLFYQDTTSKLTGSTSIYFVIKSENKHGLKAFSDLIINLDNILKDSHSVGYTPKFAYKKYRDVDIVGSADSYNVYTRVNDNSICKKTYYYTEDTHDVAIDIIMHIFSDEI